MARFAGEPHSKWSRTVSAVGVEPTMPKRELYRLPVTPVTDTQERKKVESNHRLLHRPPLAGEVAPTGHIFQAESEGVEPSGVTLARFSRPFADQPAPPSKLRASVVSVPTTYAVTSVRLLALAAPPGFEPRPVGSEPTVLPLHQGALAKVEGFEPSPYGFGDRRAQPTLTNMARSGFEPEASSL